MTEYGLACLCIDAYYKQIRKDYFLKHLRTRQVDDMVIRGLSMVASFWQPT